jgi:predicted permease
MTIPRGDSAAMLRRTQAVDELLARLRGLPRVSNVAATSAIPFGAGCCNGRFLIMSRPNETIDWKMAEVLSRDPVRAGEAEYRVVSPGYFETLGIPLLRGRAFNSSDARDAQPVAVISASLAQKQWPNDNPIGKIIQYGNMDGDLRTFTIVGVVGDVREFGFSSPPRPTFYGMLEQRPSSWYRVDVAIATTGDPTTVMTSARGIARELFPAIPPRVRTLESILGQSVADRKFTLLLIAIFGVSALALAALGVYSVISYLVTQRAREISIRVALGAVSGDIVSMVLRQGVTLALIGIVIGAAASLVVTRFFRAMLYDVSAADPIAFLGVTFVLTVAALVASWLPARRAGKVEAMQVLRGG